LSKVKDLKTDVFIDWCPGCGDYGILMALSEAIKELKLDPSKTVIVSGIGQAAKTPHFVAVNGVHTLHGRALPVATGIKLANPELEVIIVGGDGDGLGIGAGHMVNAGRRNLDMTYLFYNNEVYGLTKGQASPTLRLGVQTKALPKPNINQGVNPIHIALAAGYTFIARSFAFDLDHLKSMIVQGIMHKGMAFIDILQPCPTYNNIHTAQWYKGEDRIDPDTGKPKSRLKKIGKEHEADVKKAEDEERIMKEAMELANIWDDDIPIGVFYRNELVSDYIERLEKSMPSYMDNPPVKQVIANKNNEPTTDINRLLEEWQLK
jgi:2-oxoglutarate ferredoxin oxidoreductase subunit beta